MKTVAIIGGGFCGTMAAVNLARLARAPLRIVLVNHGSPLGRGVAYGTRQTEHLLNVAARNMSAFPDQAGHFVDWLRTRSEYADMPDSILREQFVPRKTYGDYLQALLFWHTKGSLVSKIQIEQIDGEALDVVPLVDRIAVVVAGQPTIAADQVLLATGNPPPAELGVPTPAEHPRLIGNPWHATGFAQADRRDNVVLIGAGLTMIDVFLTLTSLDWQGTIWAVSRSGLLPLAHFQGIAYADFPPADVAHLNLAALAELMHEHCRRLRERGENPAIVVDKLRPFTQRIWQNLSVADKRAFLSEYRTRWNVMRHRVAASIHAQLTAALEAKRLQVLPGRLAAISATGDRLEVAVDTKGGQRVSIEAGWVVNCTGPLESCRHAPAGLYQNLLDRGLVQPDELDMGIKIGPDFRAIDGGGYASAYLHAIGPMLKGTLWETTAVPELRIQALQVAQTLLTSLEGEASPGWFAEMWVDVVEYVI